MPPTKNNFKNYLKTKKNYFILFSTAPEDISDIIQTLKLNKSTGPNSLSLKVLKSIKGIILVPFCELINKSFTVGVFPNMCKIAKVVPVSNIELRLYYNNYRPISPLSNIAKIIEKIIHIQLINFLDESNCFYDFQFGLGLNISTNTALMSVIGNIQNKLDQGEYTAGVFVDLKKAFNTVDHNILIDKPELGVRGVTKEWFCSYLWKRNNLYQLIDLSLRLNIFLLESHKG